MQNGISLVLSTKFFSWLGLIAVLTLAIALRIPELALFKCDYLSDCGRDLLVAKHMTDGTASLWTSPISALEFLPNTPQYYWILAIPYSIGGLATVYYFNAFVGVMVVWLTYLIVRELTDDGLLSWFASVVAAALPSMIRASVSIWQPHWQLLFGAIAILLCLRAFRIKTPRAYFIAAISLWPLINQEYLALPIAGMITIWLGWSWWEQAKFHNSFLKKFWLFFMLGSIWLSWLGLVLLLQPNSGNSVHQNLAGIEIFSLQHLTSRPRDLAMLLVHFLVDERYFNFWVWLLPLPILAAGYRWITAQNALKETQLGFLLSLLATVGMLFVDSGKEVSEWHFLLQQYLFLLCSVLVPHFLHFSRRGVFCFSITLLGLLTYQNRFLLNPALRDQLEPNFGNVVTLAQVIDHDVQKLSLQPTQVGFLVKKFAVPKWMMAELVENDVKALRETYESAGLQLALEQLDSRYGARIRIVPVWELWSNYVQTAVQTYYVICVDYPLEALESCVSDLALTNTTLVQKSFLGIIPMSAAQSAALYRVQFE